jgi:hypothetical protein
MPALATAYPLESSTSTALTSRRLPRDEIARLVRHRASQLKTTMPVELLVQRTLERFDETFGGTAYPVNLEGWIRRATGEIAAVHAAGPARGIDHDQLRLSTILQELGRSVRSPALAKQRKLLLRRLSVLIGRAEYRVVLAMITEPSFDVVADRFGISPVDVARLHRRGLLRLQEQLDRDPELARQLQAASRQPSRARTAR